LLPIISLLTVLVIVGSAELIARKMFTVSAPTSIERCMVLDDPSTGIRAVPNSVCWEKSFEGPLVEYKFNGCGHRTAMECNQKPLGTYRIVQAGSSYAIGKRVSREESFAALLPIELSQKTGRRVELYNEGFMMWGTPRVVSLQTDKILAARPDLILLVVSPWDIDNVSILLPEREAPDLGLWTWLKTEIASEAPSEVAKDIWAWSRAAYMLQHFLYMSQSQYVKAYLMQGRPAEFLKAQQSVRVQANLEQFDLYAAHIEDRAKAVDIPFAAVFIPNRAQAAMISMGNWPAGYDPYKLNEELRTIITRHGGTYIDILPDYRNITNPERGYYPMDGHPNVEGSAMISKMLAKELTNGAIPALQASNRQAAMEQEK
jgi:hypothetical protein